MLRPHYLVLLASWMMFSFAGQALGQRPPGDTIVALHAGGKLLGYSVDTLVNFLNSNNTNPNYRYVRFADDDSRNGYSADFVLDLSLVVSRAQVQAPSGRPLWSNGFEGPVAGAADARHEWDPLRVLPAAATCTVNVLEKWNQEKKSWFRFTVEAPSDNSLPIRFVMGLLHQLLHVRYRGGTCKGQGQNELAPNMLAVRRFPGKRPAGPPAVAVHVHSLLPDSCTVDTLVKYLGHLNENPRVRYISLADDLSTGYFASHVVDIWLDVMQTDSSAERQHLPGAASETGQPVWARCRIAVRKKSENKISKFIVFPVSAQSEQELRNSFLIEVMYQLLEQQFAPKKSKARVR